jgi:hypothetical protein
VRDVAEPVPGAALLDALEQRLARGGEQALRDGRDVPDRDRDRRVRDPAVENHADVDREDVAAAQLVGARDPVDDHRVRRRADRAGEAAVSEEGGLAALRADEALGGLVELEGGHAGAHLPPEHRQRARQHAPGGADLIDLLGCLPDDHGKPSVPGRRG